MTLSTIENLKKEGNEFFKNKNWKEAIERYTQAIRKISSSTIRTQDEDLEGTNAGPDFDYLKATLLSNRSLCHMQLFENHAGEENDQDSGSDVSSRGLDILEEVVRDTSASLEILKACKTSTVVHSIGKSAGGANGASSMRTLRAKLLYRRAKANYAVSQMYRNNAAKETSTSKLQKFIEQSQQYKIKAVQDLHDLLSFDSKNKLAQALLIDIQQHEQQRKQSCHPHQNCSSSDSHSQSFIDHLMASSSSTTSPIQKALSSVCQYYFEYLENQEISESDFNSRHQHNLNGDDDDDDNDQNWKKVIQSLQFLYSSFAEDLISTAQEVLSYQTTMPVSSLGRDSTDTIQGLEILYDLAFHSDSSNTLKRQKVLDGLEHRDSKDDHLEIQSLSMQILNEACMCLPLMHKLDTYHSQQLSTIQNNEENIIDPNQQHRKKIPHFALSIFINLLLPLNNDRQINTQNQIYKGQITRYIQLCTSFYIRYILYLHIKEDNKIHELVQSTDQKEVEQQIPSKILPETAHFLIPIIIQIYSLSLQVPRKSTTASNDNSLFSIIQSTFHAIITLDPQSILHQQIQNNNDQNNNIDRKQTSKLLCYFGIKPLSAHEIHVLKARELALYRKKQYMIKQNQKHRCRNYAILFCKRGGLDMLLQKAVFSENYNDKEVDYGSSSSNSLNDYTYYCRREIMITISKIILCYTQSNENVMQKIKKNESLATDSSNDNEKAEQQYSLNDKDLKKHVIDKFFSSQDYESSLSTLTIEEIDEDGDEDVHDGGFNKYLELNNNILTKSLLSTSILLANGDLGTWVLRKAWPTSQDDWKNLVGNPIEDKVDNHTSMSIASELASAAASVEPARPWITSCAGNIDDNLYWKKLLSSDNHDVRSGAASAMAKLGLSDKKISSDEGELFSLLEVAGGLIVGDEVSNKLSDSNSITQLERGIELLSYLSSKTMIKDEIAHGYNTSYVSKGYNSSKGEKSLLEHLVDLSSNDSLYSDQKKMSSSVSYALSTVFSSMTVSIETLRKEAFADKEITVEQYDQLQAMGKTNEEKELEESKIDKDSPEAVKSRIQKMASKGVCIAIVNLIEKGSSEQAKQQLVSCMVRMATEQSIRGKMIQDGCLSECLRISKKDISNYILSSSEKKIIRHAQHTIGKLLITTNPALLSTSQRMGSVQPLIQLVKDHEASDLQRFEALLSLTNLATFDDETKNRIVAESGISVLSYAMFSEHEMVRRAATEAMSNLVPHKDVISYLRQPEKLKVWVAFASDFDLNYECSRAASGCLAMVIGDEEIACEFCKLSSSRTMVEEILSSGKLELMHRILVVLVNLVEHEREWVISSGSLAFCEAYVQKFQQKEFDELKFSSRDIETMMITIRLAQDIITGLS